MNGARNSKGVRCRDSSPGAFQAEPNWLLLGLASIIGAPKQAIDVMNSGGGRISFPVSVFERDRTVEFANRVSEALAGTPSRGVAPTPVVDSRQQSGTTAEALLFPVVTGQTGTRPIFEGAADFDLELIESRTLDGHTQELIYRPTLHG